MDLLRRLHRAVRSRLPSPDKEPVIIDSEPRLDVEQAGENCGAQTGPTPQSSFSASSHDPKLAQWYANLEIPYGADLETAKKAWRRLMKRYHPDLHSIDPGKKEVATELTRKLTEAYQELEKRLKA